MLFFHDHPRFTLVQPEEQRVADVYFRCGANGKAV
jgi:hypothetical protein